MVLEYEPHPRARWSGPDVELVQDLNTNVNLVLSCSGYYPVEWYMVKAVADELGGTLNEPEPDLGPIDPSVEY